MVSETWSQLLVKPTKAQRTFNIQCKPILGPTSVDKRKNNQLQYTQVQLMWHVEGPTMAANDGPQSQSILTHLKLNIL